MHILRCMEADASPAAGTVHAVRRPKAAEVVAWEIRRKIINGEISEGDNLPPEPALIRSFNVSRPTLREALRILESQDLIAIDQGQRKGARVRLPNIDHASLQIALLMQVRRVTLREIIDAWLLLEPKVVALLAHHSSHTVTRALRAAIGEVPAAATGDEDTVHRCRDFHEMLLEANENSALGSIVGILRRIVQMHFDAALVSYSGLATQIQEVSVVDQDHSRLIDRIEAGDGGGAEDQWRSHIASAGQALIDEFGADSLVVLPPQ